MSLRFSNIQGRWLAGALFFVTSAAYVLTAYPTVSTEDSGEFATAIHTLGIPHPSGYPLYVILGKIFSLLMPFGSPAWKANLFSACCSAAAVAALYLLLRAVLRQLWDQHTTHTVPLVTALLFASGELFWSQAIRAEVYGLNSLLFILVLLLALRWKEQHQMQEQHQPQSANPSKTLLWLAFIFGLSLTNHHLMALAGLPLLLWVLMVYPKIIKNLRLLAACLALFMLGLSLYLFLPLRASYQVPLNWGNPNTIEKTWQHVTRAFYSADAVDASLNFITEESAPVAPSQTSSSTGTATPSWPENHITGLWSQATSLLAQNYTYGAVILALAGMVITSLKSPKIAILWVALVLFYSTVASALLGLGITEKLPIRFFIDRPFYIPLFILLTIPVATALQFLAEKITSALGSQKRDAQPSNFSRSIPAIAAFALVFLAVVTLAMQIPKNDQSQNYLAYAIAAEALENLPQQAVLVSENHDNTLFPLLYLKVVEGRRPDVDVYITAPVNIFHYFRSLEDTLTQNPGRRLFTDFPFISYPNKTYTYGGTFSEIVPSPQLATQPPTQNSQLSPPSTTVPPQQNQQSTATAKSLLPFNLKTVPPNLDHFHQYLLARWYTDQGLAYHAQQPTEEALQTQRQLFQKAWETAPQSRNILGQLMGQYLVINARYTEAIPYLEEAHRLMPNEYPVNFQLAYAYFQTNQQAKAQTLIQTLPPDQKQIITAELTTLLK